MNDGERFASYAIAGTSIAALIVAIVELPASPSSFNLILAAVTSLFAIVIFVLYYASRKKFVSRVQEEDRLKREFPAVFAFLENIDSIRGEGDFRKLETQLSHLIETERQRSIKWKEMHDIEAVRGIALARLVQKKRFKS